jgi:hypothetical protein
VDVVDEDQLGAQFAQQVAYGAGDLGLVEAVGDGHAEEPGEFADEHLRGGGRRHADEQHRPARCLF